MVSHRRGNAGTRGRGTPDRLGQGKPGPLVTSNLGGARAEEERAPVANRRAEESVGSRSFTKWYQLEGTLVIVGQAGEMTQRRNTML